MNIPPKHSAGGTTIFTTMSALATKHNAINLSQGFPDFAIDTTLIGFLKEATEQHHNQYAPMAGLPMLKQAIAEDLQQRYDISIDEQTEITITPGATYGIYTAFTTILQKGDEVIVIEPAYDSYIPNIEMNGAAAVCIPLQTPEFNMDWKRVQEAINTKTKAIIINTPHNPTGTAWQNSDWDNLANIVRGTDIFILSDEVYEQIVFDGRKHQSIMQHDELRQRSFAIFSFGKVFHNTGWKIGYVVASPALTAAFRQAHQYLSFSVNTPAQYATAKYLTQPSLPNVGMMMQQKRDYFLSLMSPLPFTIHRPSSGSYFQIVGYENISDLPDLAFAEWLTKEYGVATIPISPFYKQGSEHKLVRFCFAKKEETLATAIERLSRLLG